MIPAVISAATVVVEIFTSVDSLARAIGIRGKTQHFSDAEAEQIASTSTRRLVDYVKTQYSAAQVQRVIEPMISNYNVLRNRFWPGSYQSATGEYLSQRPDRHDVIVNQVQSGVLRAGDPYMQFHIVLFQTFMWAWRNVDRDKPQENLRIVAEAIYPVLVGASFDTAGLDSAPLRYTAGTQQNGLPPGNGPTPTPEPTVALAGLGGPIVMIALAGAGVYFLAQMK